MNKSTGKVKLILWLSSIAFAFFFAFSTAIIVFISTESFVKPEYQTSSSIMIQNYSEYSSTQSTTSNITDNNAGSKKDSESLTEDCVVLFSNSPEMTSLMSNASVTIEQVDDSNFIRFNVISANPQVAANVANQLADQATKTFDDTFGKNKGKVDIIQGASVPQTPISPNVNQKTIIVLLGFLIGLCFGVLISLIVSILIYKKYKTKMKTTN